MSEERPTTSGQCPGTSASQAAPGIAESPSPRDLAELIEMERALRRQADARAGLRASVAAHTSRRPGASSS